MVKKTTTVVSNVIMKDVIEQFECIFLIETAQFMWNRYL